MMLQQGGFVWNHLPPQTIALSAVAAALILRFLYPILVYILDPKGLRKYPAPSVAAFTQLWQMYHNWHGQKFLAVDRVHKELGPVVRLGPSHLSFSSPQAFKDIYGHGASLRKDTFYDNQGGDNPNMAEASDKEVHRGKRRNLAHVFAPGQITSMEPRVMEVVRKLIHALEQKSKGLKMAETDRFEVTNGVFDLRPWMNMFSYDAITNVFWSQTYGFLDRGNDDCLAETADGSIKTVNAMSTFHTGAGHSVLLGHLSPFWYNLMRNVLLGWTRRTQCGNTFTDMARHLAKTRLNSPPSEPDLFSNLPTLPTAKRCAHPMSLDEIVAESGVMLNAGNDTTQTSLTNTMYFLAANRSTQQKLRGILQSRLDQKHIPIAPYEILRHIPYLRAVLDESFRLQTPLGTGLPRLTTETTLIDGELVAAGVTVSAQTWSLHRREDLFYRADQWVPDRWIPESGVASDEERQNLKDYVLPFSLGPRACIGRNLAYMELSICIAAMVLAFEWELPEKGQALRHHERFNCNPVELPIRAKCLL
ncbi:hypothetical protein H2204_003423 [Knufia peltigerae]|uniref:Cytochrome P450 n=1 Tax=Knufia peltigerae TaxID=1002370 RepID=A0AA38Y9M7_9EURO|nr:hypothetical protein H2204_003423 [Knufia peltigerae]